MRQIIIFICLWGGLSSCEPERRLSGKTQQIDATNALATVNTKALAIVTPFVISATFSDLQIIQNIRDSLFNIHVSPKQYKVDTAMQKKYQHYSIKAYKKFLKKYFDLQFPKISVADETALKNEVNSLKIKLTDSTSNMLLITPYMASILSKYSNEALFLITDIADYSQEGVYGVRHRKPHAWNIFRVFIFDPNQRKVIFYRYKINGILSMRPFFNSTSSLERMLKKFIKK